MMRALHCWKTRRVLRQYLLGTLSDDRNAAVSRHLDECAACRTWQTREREQIHLLDSLPDSRPPAGLAERTLARIQSSAATDLPAIEVEARTTSRMPSYAGLALAATLVFVLVTGNYLVLQPGREAARRSTTQNKMKTLAVAFKMYANESNGDRWPSLASDSGVWAPDLDQVYEKFIETPDILFSEHHPDRKALLESLHRALNPESRDYDAAERLMGESFGYLGYAVEDIADFETVYVAKAESSLPIDGAPIPETDIAESVPPLREGIERFMITDINNPAGSARAQSTIPVLVEIASWKHKKSVKDFQGANVLYMDGHVEFIRYGTFPVVEPVLNALSGILVPE